MKQQATQQSGIEFALQPRSDRAVPMLDDPPLGHVQVIVLRTLYDLESEAYGLNVLQTLSLKTGVWIDHSQIYSIIRKLVKNDLIKVKEVRAQEGKRPALKIYELSADGLAALKAATEHHEAVAAYLKEGKVN